MRAFRAGALVLTGVVAMGLAGTARADDEKQEGVQRFSPSGRYSHPSSFFWLHGYATATYTLARPELGTDPLGTPHILLNGLNPLTGSNPSGFSSDAALFVGADPLEGVGVVVEIHFVGNGLNPVLTEARFAWTIVDGATHPVGLRLAGGRYWWPFGIHNAEWFSALNPFNILSPAAREVVPAHYNEVGLLLEGEAELGGGFGLNFVGSIGNGVPGFEIMDAVGRTPYDFDGTPSGTGRLGFAFVRDGLDVQLGFSTAGGELRAEADPARAVDDPHAYPGRFMALGPDLTVGWKDLSLTGYYYLSTETLDGAAVPGLARRGGTIQLSYDIGLGEDLVLMGVEPVVRLGTATEETLTGESWVRTQYAFGAQIHCTEEFDIDLAYVLQQEGGDMPALDDDAFIVSLTAVF